MNEQDFLIKIRGAIKTNIMTGAINLTCLINKDRTKYIIKLKQDKKICPYCHTDLTKQAQEIEVLFNKSQEHLSVFQAGLLYSVWKYNKLPYDYAQYHKCIAGKSFINNIIEVKGGLS